MPEEMLRDALVVLPLFARAIGLIETAPLLSSRSVPQIARVALALFAAFAVYPSAPAPPESLPSGLFGIALVLAGEALIGVITGFFIRMIFAAAESAGEFFSLQTGFGASEAFDPLPGTANPLMGQFLGMAATLTFLLSGGLQTLFLGGFLRSVQTLSVAELAAGREAAALLLAGGLAHLFTSALVISLPILGTLLLTTLATGLVSRAAPQINLLSEGFSVSIGVALLSLMAALPFIAEAIARALDGGFRVLQDFFIQVGGQI
jgi:flagellar biosynthetic protein FliR